jgi:hypothetical protein
MSEQYSACHNLLLCWLKFCSRSDADGALFLSWRGWLRRRLACLNGASRLQPHGCLLETHVNLNPRRRIMKFYLPLFAGLCIPAELGGVPQSGNC